MKKKIRLLTQLLTVLVFILILTNSCKDEDIPVLSTTSVSKITENSAISGGVITSDGNSKIIARGVCWSTDPTPTITSNKTIDSLGIGSFTSHITGLNINTQYYVRAYATNSTGTGYGNVLSFTTQLIVTDIDSNIYHTVTIGTQVWMVENLKVTHYRNGDPIPNVTIDTNWIKLTTGGYCDYLNTPDNSIIYGRLYNWYAVNDNRNIAPTGWHVPSNSEWLVLINYLGGESIAGGKLKEKETVHWQSPNTGATNESGFTALPGGIRYSNDGHYTHLTWFGYWWTTTDQLAFNYAFYRIMSFNYINGLQNAASKVFGLSVRCIKD